MSTKTVLGLKFDLLNFRNGNNETVKPTRARSREGLDELIEYYNQPGLVSDLTVKPVKSNLSFMIPNVMKNIAVNRADAIKIFESTKYKKEYWLTYLVLMFSGTLLGYFSSGFKTGPSIIISGVILSYFILRGFVNHTSNKLKKETFKRFAAINDALIDPQNSFGVEIKKFFFNVRGKDSDFTIYDIAERYEDIVLFSLNSEEINLDEILDEINEFNDSILYFSSVVIVDILLIASLTFISVMTGLSVLMLFNHLILGVSANGFFIKELIVVTAAVIFGVEYIKSVYRHIGTITYLGWGARRSSRVIFLSFNLNNNAN